MSWPYQRLGHYLDCPIIGIQQILQGEEAEPQSIREMARIYADRIQEMDPTGPYNLLGWSFGGLVAHEIAIELQQRGYVIGRLIVFDAQFSLEGATLPNHPLEDKQMLEEAFRFCGIDIPEQDEPLTYEQLEKVPAIVELSVPPLRKAPTSSPPAASHTLERNTPRKSSLSSWKGRFLSSRNCISQYL